MRVQRWPERMIEVIRDHERLPFRWGKSDCWCLALDVAKAMTGVDPYEEERRYRSINGYRRRLLKRGFRSIEEALAAAYEEVPPSMAQRGDIGIVTADGAAAACVCEGPRWVGKAQRGVVRFPLSAVRRAFRVR